MQSASTAMLPVRPDLAMTGLALVSGVLSALFGSTYEPAWLEPVARLFFLSSGMMPIGVFFGVALGLGVVLTTGRIWAAPLLLITTLIAWSMAIHVALWVLGDGGTQGMRMLLASVAAGGAGAFFTHLGAVVVSTALRRPLGILMTTVVGAVCGALYYLGEQDVVPDGALYVVWQPAVALCLGVAMTRARSG